MCNSCVCPQDKKVEKLLTVVTLSHVDTHDPVTQRHRKRCCPYNFDGKKCRVVGDRYICGYNMNVNNPNSNEIKDLGNGCKLRHGRLECGYDQAPYVNLRRPPAVDYHSGNNDNNDKNDKHDNKDKNRNESAEGLDEKEENVENDEKLKLHVTISSNHFTRCLEVKDRIVCRHV